MSISKLSMTNAEVWERPNIGDVYSMFLTAEREHDTKVELIFGVSNRTVRRWCQKSRAEKEPELESPIPYNVWAVLVDLIHDLCILDFQLNRVEEVKARIPEQYFCSADKFESPKAEMLTQFFGSNSITGMTRKQVAKVMGWDAQVMGRTVSRGNLAYSQWVSLLLFCGFNMKDIILK